MAVALEFYEKGVPIETVAEITENSSQTAFVMKKLFRNVMEKLQEAGKAGIEADSLHVSSIDKMEDFEKFMQEHK